MTGGYQDEVEARWASAVQDVRQRMNDTDGWNQRGSARDRVTKVGRVTGP